jgi:hypothetical protein
MMFGCRRIYFVLSALLIASASLHAQAPSSGSTSGSKSAANPEAKSTGKVADFRSKNYLLHTDLDKVEAEKLLVRLETMLRLISTYWGKPQNGIVELYVAKDIRLWPREVLQTMPAHGISQIVDGAGVTTTEASTIGGKLASARAVVYACAEKGTPEHEAVHAYCGQTYGTAGPVWYAEGMAEMGNYWREKEPGVQCIPEVVKYIKGEPRKKALHEIIDNEERTGDSWENYCWRWALCHLLVNNPNYNKEFALLGRYLLIERKHVTFDETFGPVADKIAFEYDQFLENFNLGYRVENCAWVWKYRFAGLGTTPINARVQAERGWQPSGAIVKTEGVYEFTTTGKWKLSKDVECTAAGDKAAKAGSSGKLLGAILTESTSKTGPKYRLSKPIDLGEKGEFTAPAEGQLYLRCEDDWCELGDNKGFIAVQLKQKKR